MASQSIPVPFQKARAVARARLSVHAPSVRTAAIVVITVAILFRWLHLILALQITSTGRQIQAKTAELHEQERATAILQEEIAIAESPQTLAIRASLLGYAPCAPVYVTLSEPVAGTGGIAVPWTASNRLADHFQAFATWLGPSGGP